MSNEKLIKSAHLWLLGLLIVAGTVALAASSSTANLQNSNSQNSNSNSNQNQNANRNSNSNSMMSNSNDSKFAMEAAAGGLMEVEVGKLGTTQGSTETVKQFAQKMVTDHSKANEELTRIATAKGMTLPTALNEKQRAAVDKLAKLTGAEFDKAFAKMMVSDHHKDVALFEKQSMHGTDSELKGFAARTLPTLKEHQALAKTLSGAVSGPKTTNSNNSNRH